MKPILTVCFTAFILNVGIGQVIPDLLSTDNYRPYLSEQQLQQDILKNSKKEGHPRTSQQLYPELYKYANAGQLQKTNDPLGVVPSLPDPSEAIPNYTQTSAFGGFTATTYSGQQSEINKQQLAQYERDRAEQLARVSQQQKAMAEAQKDYLSIPQIKYDLGEHNGKPVEGFESAYSELQQMLMGQAEIDFVKAIYLVESAYDQSLGWDEYISMFNNSKQVIERLIIQDGLDPNDNMAKIMSIFKYMADTTEVFFEEREKFIKTNPMLYDYDDYAGKKDATKIFVSKKLRTGTGQCMSLPTLFYLYAKALNTKDVFLAVAPQHSYITFKDKLENWHNIELTGRMFSTDDFQWQGGFVKAPQVKSGIYLKPLNDKETIAYFLTTLAITYIKSFGNDNRAYDMALTAKQYFPNSLTANKIVAGYFQDTYQNIQRQYAVHRLTQNDFDNDSRAKAIKAQRDEAIEYLYKGLGYAKIPDWAYEEWLEGVNELANKRQHIVKRRQLEQQLNR